MIILDDPQILEPQTATHDTNASSPASKFPLFFEWRKTSPWYPCQWAAGQPFSDWSSTLPNGQRRILPQCTRLHYEILHDYISVVCLVEEIQRLSCKCSPAQISQPPSISILPSVHVGKLIERNLIPNSLILSYPFILSPRLEVQGLANNETKSLLMIVVFDFPNLAGCAENRENQHASFVFSILFQAVQNSSKVWLTSVHVFLKFSMPTRLNWCFWDLSRARYEYWNNTEKNPNQVSKFCRSCISNGGPARVMTEPPSENSEFLLLPTAGGHWCKACSVLGAAVGGPWTLLFCCVSLSWAISTHPCNWKLDFSYLSYINICDHC